MSFFLAAVATRCRWHPQSRLAAQVFARRLILLNRVNAAAMANAERFSDEAAKIAALARAIRRSGVSLIDRVAMLETIEHLATLAEAEAALDRNCIEYFCDCEPDQWDHIEHQLNSTSDPVTKH